MYDILIRSRRHQQPQPLPKARVRTRRNAVTSVLLAAFMVLPVVASGQSGPADRAREAPPSAAAPTSAALDIDRLVAAAADRGVLLQRSRPGQGGNSNANTMRWVGIAMLGAGGLLAVNGALATCGTIDSGVYRETGMCGGRVIVGGGVAALGAWLMTR